MGTSCIIKVQENKTAVLYKHWDGYPEATLNWLKDFNETFVKNRGDDSPYKLAQLVRSSLADAEKYGLDASRETGWGLYPEGEISGVYTYILNKDGSVTVR